MPPILAGRELRKSWRGTLVLELADFVIQEGEEVAPVGPNGVGKSTLFKLLAGETKPDVVDQPRLGSRRAGSAPTTDTVGSGACFCGQSVYALDPIRP